MIKTIVHCTDLHIEKSTKRHEEYKLQLEKTIKEIKLKKPDRIVFTGDLYHDFISMDGGEALSMAGMFIKQLSEIAPTVLILGNHDIQKKNRTRKNMPETITELIDNTRVTLYTDSGFYEDDNVVWTVWSYLDKLNPWQQIKHKRKKDKIYIDLFHDPVYGCIGDNGEVMRRDNYTPITAFKGDYGMFGDIHLRQFFSDTQAYAGSMLQRGYGETVEGHGFILWDIENKTNEKIDIPNPNKYINLFTEIGFDYDNIQFKDETPINPDDVYNVKIHWKDLVSRHNKENEIKLRDYVKNKYKPIEFKFKRIKISENINSVKALNENFSITNLESIQDIFKEYLKLNKYEEDIITKVLELDNKANERLDWVDRLSGYDYDVVGAMFNNFRAFGDNNKVELENWKGIVQITGVNQVGKTTLLDVISYVKYGKILATKKTKKFGDERFINNKRDLDYCDGAVQLRINNEYYTLYRKTERKFKKNKIDLASCTTTFDIYDGLELIEEKKVSEERRPQTQKKLDMILGKFEDFLRLVLINADNLNDLLSMDRSEFIDSILRDAGYTMFEDKLKAFKEYRKEISEGKIKLDHEAKKAELALYQKDLELKNSDLILDKTKVKDIEAKLKEYYEQKNKFTAKLHTIDLELDKVDIDDINNKIKDYGTAISEQQNLHKTNKVVIDSLPEKYDSVKLESCYKEMKVVDDRVQEIKLEISGKKNKVSEAINESKTIEVKVTAAKDAQVAKIKSDIKDIDNKINMVDWEAQSIVDDFLGTFDQKEKDLNSNIEKLNGEIDLVKEKLRSEVSNANLSLDAKVKDLNLKKTNHLKDTLSDTEIKIKEFDSKALVETEKFNSIIKEGQTLKKQVKDLEDNKTCPLTCKPMITTCVEHIKTQVDEMNKNLESMRTTAREHKTLIEEYQAESQKLVSFKNQYETSEEYKTYCANVDAEIALVNKDRKDSTKLDFDSDERIITKKNEISNLNASIIKVKKEKEDAKIGTLPENIQIQVKEKNKEKDVLNDSIKNQNIIIKEIEENKFDNCVELANKIKELYEEKFKLAELAKNAELEAEKLNLDIDKKLLEKETFEKEALTIEAVKEEVKKRQTYVDDNEKISLRLETVRLSLESSKTLIDRYNTQLKLKELNKEIEIDILKINDEILNVDSIKSTADKKVTDLEKEISVLESNSNRIQSELDKYMEQIKLEELYDLYEKCVNRDGIPMFLLQKSRDVINNELEKMMEMVDFLVFFDKDMNLRMSMKNRLDVVNECPEGSGKERTFISCALKMALREINNVSKPMYIFMDEIMGKLIGESITEFLEFLQMLKTRINKIFIIEHIHDVNPDYIIHVKKDPNELVSKFVIEE